MYEESRGKSWAGREEADGKERASLGVAVAMVHVWKCEQDESKGKKQGSEQGSVTVLYDGVM